MKDLFEVSNKSVIVVVEVKTFSRKKSEVIKKFLSTKFGKFSSSNEREEEEMEKI